MNLDYELGLLISKKNIGTSYRISKIAKVADYANQIIKLFRKNLCNLLMMKS